MRKSMRRAALLWVVVTVGAAAAPATRPAVVVTVDTTDAPEMAAFGGRVKAVIEAWCPKIVAALPSDGFTGPKNISVVFRRDYKGVAECSGDRIKASADWFTKHPDDLGAFVHELTHAVQHYDRGRRPGWLTEGIADYVRFYLYEPASARPHPAADKAQFDASYRTTAAFLDWCQRTYDPALVRELNAACREARYTSDLWKQRTGKTADALGAEWRAGLAPGR